MILTCVIVDDEYLAIKILEDYVSHNESLQLAHTFKYPQEALKFLLANKIDLLFLDIQMPELDGFGILSKLEKPPMVIFTTARPDYAFKAYELNILDYLLKPISISRFQKAVEKAVEYSNLLVMNDILAHNRPDYMMISADFQVHKICFKDIIFIEGLSEYVKIHCLTSTHVTLASLKGLEARLEGFRFTGFTKALSSIKTI